MNHLLERWFFTNSERMTALSDRLWQHPEFSEQEEYAAQAMLSLDYTFTGKASHAAMAPQEGLSALDAVELMNVGANYLREHIPPGGQLHYVITNGGEKPNIVPERAAVWYFIRAASSSDVARIRARLDDIARGAALMTGAKVSSAVRTGCNETRIVPALASILNDVMCREMAAPYWSAEEKDFSSALVFGLGMDKAALRADYGTDVGERPLHDGVEPLTGKTIHITGSSDLSDVSWVVPTGMLFSACYPKGIPNHTWAVTACSGMSIGHKGMLYAAQVLAAAGLRLVSDPALMEEVKTSFRICMGNDHYQAAVAR